MLPRILKLGMLCRLGDSFLLLSLPLLCKLETQQHLAAGKALTLLIMHYSINASSARRGGSLTISNLRVDNLYGVCDLCHFESQTTKKQKSTKKFLEAENWQESGVTQKKIVRSQKPGGKISQKPGGKK